MADGEYEAGLVIHEGQITYRDLGLRKLGDLGAAWKDDTGLPLPLGLDVVRKDLGRELATHVIVMPHTALDVALAMVAWGNLAELESIDVEAARSFWGEFAQRGPESGIPCAFTVDEAA